MQPLLQAWPLPRQVDGSTAAGSHGPGSSDDNRNTRRRLDAFSNPDDDSARSAVLLQFPCAQHAGVSPWLKKFLATTNMPTPICPSGFTAKQVLHLLDLCSAREPNVKVLWQHTEMMVSFMQSTALFVTPVPILWFDNPSHREDREIGRRFKPLWEGSVSKVTRKFPRQRCQR